MNCDHALVYQMFSGRSPIRCVACNPPTRRPDRLGVISPDGNQVMTPRDISISIARARAATVVREAEGVLGGNTEEIHYGSHELSKDGWPCMAHEWRCVDWTPLVLAVR